MPDGSPQRRRAPSPGESLGGSRSPLDGSLSLATLSPDRVVDSPSASTMTMELSAAALAAPHLTLAGQQSPAVQRLSEERTGHSQLMPGCPRIPAWVYGILIVTRLGPCQFHTSPVHPSRARHAAMRRISSRIQPAAHEAPPLRGTTPAALEASRLVRGGQEASAITSCAGWRCQCVTRSQQRPGSLLPGCPSPPGQDPQQEERPHAEHGRGCAGSMPRSASSQAPGSLVDEGLAGSKEASQDLGSDGFPMLKRLSIGRRQGQARASMTGEPAPEVPPHCHASPWGGL